MAAVETAPAPETRPRVAAFLPGMILDWAFKIACFAAAGAPLILLGLIIAVLYGEALPGMGEIGGTILTSEKWQIDPKMGPAPNQPDYDPTSPDDEKVVLIEKEPRVFGGASFIYGTIVTSALAMLIAVPLGIATAAYLSEIASPRVKRIGSFLVELLAAIPSVVYGFWGVNFLAPPLGHLFHWMDSSVSSNGKGLLASGIILAIMVVPYIAAISYDVCQAVPSSQRQGSLALGATRWQTISRVVIPYAQPGIIGACFLALGRALGETMAVVMLIGLTPDIRTLPFGVGYTIPSLLATELKNAGTEPGHYGALMVLALLLFGVTILMNVAARLLIWRMKTVRSTTAVDSPWRRAFWPVLLGVLCLALVWPRSMSFISGLFNVLAFYVPKVGGAIGVIGAALLVLYLLFILLNRSEWLIGAQNVNHLMTWVLRAGLAFTCAPLFLILGYLIYRGTSAIFSPLLCGILLLTIALLLVHWLMFELLKKFGRIQDVGRRVMMIRWVSLAAICGLLLPFLAYLACTGGFNYGMFTTSYYTGGGLLNAFVGSFVIVGLASLIAIPLGLLAAICLAEYRTRWFGAIVRFTSELLVGVPSIVVGVFIYALVRFLIKNWHWLADNQQFSGWAGVAALAIMMIPIVIRSAEESLKLVPQTLRNASHALGAYHWQTVVRVSVPAAMTAIITGVFLAIARIAGETAPLLMTAFGNDNLTFSPSDKMGFVPLYIFQYATGDNPADQPKAWAASLVLVMFIMILNVAVRFLTGRRAVQASRAD